MTILAEMGMWEGIVLTSMILGLCVVWAIGLLASRRGVSYSSSVRKSNLSESDAAQLSKDMKAMASDARRMGSDAAASIERLADEIVKDAAECKPGG